MFEQSILVGHATHSRFGFAISLTAQIFCISIALLIPLIYTNQLPLLPPKIPLAVPLAPAAPAHAVPKQHGAVPTVRQTVFTAPSVIPKTVATIVDTPLEQAPSNISGAVPGGIGVSNGLNVLMGTTIREAPPKPEVTKKAAPAPSNKPIRVSMGVQEARLIHKIIPTYPALARQARISGVVHLVGVIARDGTIRNLQVVSGHPLLVNAALEAVRQWRYQPTLLNGEPVEVICPIDVNFTLN